MNPFRIRTFLFISYSSLELKRTRKSTIIHSRNSLENRTQFQQNGQSLYPFSDQNGSKTPTLWSGTYLYRLYKVVPTGPPPPLPGWEVRSIAFCVRF